ncbi:MAG: tRNA (guanosine(37)-N1)-methyltransferase TrmD [Methyloligellaceae bacterium]
MVENEAHAEPWRAVVLTLFPDMFPGSLGHSLIGRGLEAGRFTVETLNIRDFATDRHRSVDDTPSGGGAGMVMKADVLAAALDHAQDSAPGLPAFCLSARGRPFKQQDARKLAQGDGAILLCGRFEGIDERLFQRRSIEEISIGDFVLAGGESAALAVLESIVRLLPRILGSEASLLEESFENGLLEYPQYTRPQKWEGVEIPEVLTSGNHKRVEDWRRAQSEEITRERRPDMWAAYGTRKK